MTSSATIRCNSMRSYAWSTASTCSYAGAPKAFSRVPGRSWSRQRLRTMFRTTSASQGRAGRPAAGGERRAAVQASWLAKHRPDAIEQGWKHALIDRRDRLQISVAAAAVALALHALRRQNYPLTYGGLPYRPPRPAARGTTARDRGPAVSLLSTEAGLLHGRLE